MVIALFMIYLMVGAGCAMTAHGGIVEAVRQRYPGKGVESFDSVVLFILLVILWPVVLGSIIGDEFTK